MVDTDIQQKLHSLTNDLVDELILLTTENMSEIQFEIVDVGDGADIGLVENHPDVLKTELSERIYTSASLYLPLVKQYVPNWERTLLSIREIDGEWTVNVQFERNEN